MIQTSLERQWFIACVVGWRWSGTTVDAQLGADGTWRASRRSIAFSAFLLQTPTISALPQAVTPTPANDRRNCAQRHQLPTRILKLWPPLEFDPASEAIHMQESRRHPTTTPPFSATRPSRLRCGRQRQIAEESGAGSDVYALSRARADTAHERYQCPNADSHREVDTARIAAITSTTALVRKVLW